MSEHPLPLLPAAPARLLCRVPLRHPVSGLRPAEPDTTASAPGQAGFPLRIVGCCGTHPETDVSPTSPATSGLLKLQVIVPA